MKKKILAAILSFAMLFSVVASLGTITASAAIAEGVAWEEVFSEDFENGTWDTYFTTTKSDICYVQGKPSDFTEYGKPVGDVFRVAATSGKQSLDLIASESPLYNATNNTKVRFQFDIANENKSNAKIYVNLYGSVDGADTVSNYTSAAGRFVFTSSGTWYFDNDDYRVDGFNYVSKQWYTITIDVDCETDTYDVYCDGELYGDGIKHPWDFEKVYGIGIAAEKGSSTAKIYIDNIKYYTVKEGVATYPVTFDTNGGTINSGAIEEYEFGKGATLPTDVTKTYNTFGGWYDNAAFTGSPVTAISASEQGEKTYYAKWIPQTGLGTNVDWKEILSFDFEDDTTLAEWDEYYVSSVDDDYTIARYNAAKAYANNSGEAVGEYSMRIASSSGYMSLNLLEEASPMNASKVRFVFDLAKENTKQDFYINLVGDVDGEVTTTTTSSPSRFVFQLKDNFYFDNGDYRWDGPKYVAKEWNKVTIDIDCESNTYDVYVNDSLECLGNALPYDFDTIYGISFTAKKDSDTTNRAFVDNLRYYVERGETYAVTLNANGGTIASGAITEYEAGIGATLPAEVTKVGYAFGGWYDNANFTGSAVTAIPASATGAKTFYAKWTALPTISTNVTWKGVLDIAFDEEETASDYYKNYYEVTNEDICFVIGDARNWTNNSGEALGDDSYRIASTSGVESLNLKDGVKPLNAKKVRFVFDTAKDTTKQDFYINLVGTVDGEVVTTNQSANTRFVFQLKDKFYFDNGDYRWEGPKYVAKEWNKVTIDVDCTTGKYDVYVNDELVCCSNNLPYNFDAIHGISFSAKMNDATNKAFVDNIRYYADRTELVEELEFDFVEAYYLDGETFYCDAPVSGNVINTADVAILFAVYNSKGEQIYSVKVPYAEFNGSVETTVEGLEDVSYAKAFAWNMRTLRPLGASVQVGVEN